MIEILGIIFPSIFGLFIVEKLYTKEKITIKQLIYYICILILLSNMISIVVSKAVFDLTGNLEEYLKYPIFFVKYTFVSLCINSVIAIIITMFKKYVEISLEVKKK